jgi:hypothetical protein
MQWSALAVALVLMPPIAAAQSAQPISLVVGHPSVDGRIYQEHYASVKLSFLKDTVLQRSLSFVSHTYVTHRHGVEVCIVDGHPTAATHDTAFFQETVLERRTMALLHQEERDGTGRWLSADVNGAHIVGQYRPKAGAPVEVLDFTLETPSYYMPFVDAAIGATEIKRGQRWRLPTFSFDDDERKTTWHTYRIAGRDGAAWIVENDDGAPVHEKIWITYAPPYLPLDIEYHSDGSVVRFESSVIKKPTG